MRQRLMKIGLWVMMTLLASCTTVRQDLRAPCDARTTQHRLPVNTWYQG